MVEVMLFPTISGLFTHSWGIQELARSLQLQ